MSFLISAIAGIIVGSAAGMLLVYYQDCKASQYWKEWEARSFEFDGGRYAKDTFELVDGSIRFKKG